MTSAEIIGQVGAQYLKVSLDVDGSEGTARFLIDRMTPRHTAAIAKAILADSDLANQVDIKLPAGFLEGQGLPNTVLTQERATYYRNAKCEKPALLLASIGDDEAQSLNLVAPIGVVQLSDAPALWAKAATTGLNVLDEHCQWWEKALKGLFELHICSIEMIAEYVLFTRRAIDEEGYPVMAALGVALPVLKIPRDTGYFNSIKDKQRNHASRWRRLYESAKNKRGVYLCKQTSTHTLLNTEDLNQAFEKVKEQIPIIYHTTIEHFIKSPSGWNEEAAKLSVCEWEEVKPLFDGLKKEKLNLGEATIAFYDELDPELLDEADEDYLNRLKARGKSPQKEEEDKDFYEAHRNDLKEDRKLKSIWDRFIFGTAREATDLLTGLVLCMETLFSQKQPSNNARMEIRCDRRSKKDFKDLNMDAGLYFATYYRGLEQLFGPKVSWKVGSLFSFPDLIKAWQIDKKTKLCTSIGRAALQIKFTIELEVDLLTGGTEKYSTQLLWKFDPSSVTGELYNDWIRLVDHPMVYCSTAREPISTKGEFQPLNLANVRSFVASYGRDRGSFVSVYKKTNDIALIWEENLSEVKRLGLLSETIAEIINSKFESFHNSYKSAIFNFLQSGQAHDGIMEQLSDYADLLDALCRQAKGDRIRELLLGPVLKIGAVNVVDGKPVTVIAPWHPLRIAAMHVKAKFVKDLLHCLLSAEDVSFGDTGRFYFKDIEELLSHPFYPDIVLGWQGKKAQLLSITDAVGDYSLHESPVVSPDGNDSTNDNPKEAAEFVADLVDRYLKLYPHEKANLSVVLYNCDSVRLPQAVVNKIGAQHEEDEDVLCQIILRHRDSDKLRNLYEKIVESSDADADSYNASEATRDFMARLRINIMADQAPAPDKIDGCPTDIVFSQDVIARHAVIKWYPEDAQPVDVFSLRPSHWSRRRPAASDDMKSVVYLCCPTQSREGWAYITAITSFIKGDWNADEKLRLLPARELDFHDPEIEKIFKETHNLANWVVNYDELLDRRQLLNQSVRVIRYKQFATQGRNLIISSKAPLGLLRSMLLKRIKDLNLDLSEEEYRNLAERFISDANDISGDIVLRAAKRGRSASELIGIVLSRFLIRYELASNCYFGWYFLDDYADWLGQPEQQIADILALSPSQTDEGTLRLDVIVTEAKYIEASNLSKKRKESQKQLRDTVRRINDAVFGNPRRLDRELWLARLSDLILDGIQFPASDGINLSVWRRAIREGKCEIFLRGYSHIFISGPSDSPECSELVEVANLNEAYQEVFSRSNVRDLVLHYFNNINPTSVRLDIADKDIWKNRTYREPSGHVIIVEQKPKNVKPKSEKIIVSEEELIIQPSDGNKSEEEIFDDTESSDVKSSDETIGDKTLLNQWPYEGVSRFIKDYQTAHTDTQDELQWLKEIESRCKSALQQFQLQAKLLSSTLTPNAALLKFQGSSNLTVEQVHKRRSEFLTTHGLNIISVRAEPGKVAMAVARPERQILHLPEIWKNWKPNCTGGNCELLIGLREEDNSALILSPKNNAPHTLIAGTTGSGKSVLMQNIVLAIACTNTTEQARILLIDPKLGVDYFAFEGLPHLEGGVIDEQEGAIEQLNNLVSEMDRRYKVLRQNKVSNIFDLNRKSMATERLPFLWIIHDEFAEWMMIDEYKNEVTNVVSRLGVKARAAGIFLVFAAQRPDSNVFPMQLRANLGNRLILKVDSEGTSDIALGERGAERLLGKGHLAAKLEGEVSVITSQVPFINSQELEKIVSGIST